MNTVMAALRENLTLSWQALRSWNRKQFGIAAAATIGFGLLLGIATVLIPNSWFSRDIDTLWWNYPVWILTSIGAGMLIATYVQPTNGQPAADPGAEGDLDADVGERRTARMGIAGGVLGWFAVGCPVCNKLALLALGYSGAITWFAPIQPVLAIAALILTALALVWRLRGQVACPVEPAASTAPRPDREPAR